jgi:hypothetical protein
VLDRAPLGHPRRSKAGVTLNPIRKNALVNDYLKSMLLAISLMALPPVIERDRAASVA